MPRISTDKLQPGMVLENDVKDLSGRMLLKGGTEVAEKHLKVLRTWGILGVDIQGEESINDDKDGIELIELPEEVIAQIEGELEKRFCGIDISHPVMESLAKLVEGSLVKQHLSDQSGEQ